MLWGKKMKIIGKKIDKNIEGFISPNLSSFFSFIWGFCEGIFFFVVPDVIVGYISIYNRKRGFYSLVASIIGSLLSAIVIFYISIYYNMTNFLLNIPLITIQLIDNVQQQFILNGIPAVLYGPFNGIPYKIYSVVAANFNLSLPLFLLYSIISRISRILPVYILTSILGFIFKKQIVKNAKHTFIIYLIIWLIIYFLYFLSFLK